MITLKQIAELLETGSINNERLFLVETISSDSGFFLFNGSLCFLKKASTSESDCAVSTTYLEFRPSVQIKSVDNAATFEEGKYDILSLKNLEDEGIFEPFVNLCDLYGKNPSMPFSDFISAIVDLFQPNKKQSELDCLGLFGELTFLKGMLEKGFDLSPLWHLSGSFSKYDFASRIVNFEVKTSTDSTSFLLKHKQVFNGLENIIVLVALTHEEAMGTSLDDLISFCKADSRIAGNLRFQIELEKELQKKINSEQRTKRFIVAGIFGFKAKELPTIGQIPVCVSEISYRYDFDLTEGMDLDAISSFYQKLSSEKRR